MARVLARGKFGETKKFGEKEGRHKGRDVCHPALALMGQVGSSELKQNYQDRGVKGTIYVSGRGRMMILIYYHAPLDESGFSFTRSFKTDETLTIRSSKHVREESFIKILENFTVTKPETQMCSTSRCFDFSFHHYRTIF